MSKLRYKQICQPNKAPKERVACSSRPAYKVRRSGRATLLKRKPLTHIQEGTYMCTQAYIHRRSSHSSMMPWTYPPEEQNASVSSVFQTLSFSKNLSPIYSIMPLSHLLLFSSMAFENQTPSVLHTRTFVVLLTAAIHHSPELSH